MSSMNKGSTQLMMIAVIAVVITLGVLFVTGIVQWPGLGMIIYEGQMCHECNMEKSHVCGNYGVIHGWRYDDDTFCLHVQPDEGREVPENVNMCQLKGFEVDSGTNVQADAPLIGGDKYVCRFSGSDFPQTKGGVKDVTIRLYYDSSAEPEPEEDPEETPEPESEETKPEEQTDPAETSDPEGEDLEEEPEQNVIDLPFGLPDIPIPDIFPDTGTESRAEDSEGSGTDGEANPWAIYMLLGIIVVVIGIIVVFVKFVM